MFLLYTSLSRVSLNGQNSLISHYRRLAIVNMHWVKCLSGASGLASCLQCQMLPDAPSASAKVKVMYCSGAI